MFYLRVLISEKNKRMLNTFSVKSIRLFREIRINGSALFGFIRFSAQLNQTPLSSPHPKDILFA